MLLTDEFMALLDAALRWEPPPTIHFGVLVDPEIPTLHVLMERETGGRYEVRIDPLSDAGELPSTLDYVANNLLSEPDCVCGACRTQAMPGLDAAAAAFESSIEEIRGRKP